MLVVKHVANLKLIPGVLNGSFNDRFITLNGPFFNDPLNDRYVSKE